MTNPGRLMHPHAFLKPRAKYSRRYFPFRAGHDWSKIFEMSNSPVLDRFLAFLRASPSPFHVVENAVKRLSASGWTRLDESQRQWHLAPGGRYFMTRDSSSLVAFSIGQGVSSDQQVSSLHLFTPPMAV